MHIVDSLILELGIDLSRFERQAKQAEQAQKKLEESGKKPKRPPKAARISTRKPPSRWTSSVKPHPAW